MEFTSTIYDSVRGLAAAYATTPPVASWPTVEQAGQDRSALVAEWSGTLLATHDGRLHVVGFGVVVRVAADSVKIYVRDLTEPTPVLRDARWFATQVFGRLAGILSDDPAGVGRCGSAAELFVDATPARLVADPGYPGTLCLAVSGEPLLKSRLARQTASGSREGLNTRSGEAIRHLSAHFRGHGALIQIAILYDQKCSYRAKTAESGRIALVRAAMSLIAR